MRAGEVLALWEQTERLSPVERSLAIAGAAGADVSALRKRPIGRTNAHVVALRESLVSGDLSATATCPACGERMEFAMDPSHLHSMLPAAETTGAEALPAAGQVVGTYVVDWRSPTPEDLLAVSSSPDPEAALKRRCLTVRSADGSLADPSALSDEMVHAVEAAMAQADPLAEVLVTVECPQCAAEFEADLDLGTFVWAELAARARRLLQEVDVLARTYGWTEPEVLALTESRRAAYLRLVLDGVP